jgi:hypothetical protein
VAERRTRGACRTPSDADQPVAVATRIFILLPGRLGKLPARELADSQRTRFASVDILSHGPKAEIGTNYSYWVGHAKVCLLG